MTQKINRSLYLFLVIIGVWILSGCAGAEITSAIQYRRERKWPEADARLRAALKAEPTNDEAWTLFALNLWDMKRYEEIASIIDTAVLYGVTHRDELEVLRYNTWIELYNGGLRTFNNNPESRESQQAAIGFLNSAKQVAPDQAETYELLAQIYMAGGDTAKSVSTYEDAIRVMRSSHDLGVSQGLMLKMEPAAVERAVGGAPAEKKVVSFGSDSALVYIYPSSESYIYFDREQRGQRRWQLMGWKSTSSRQVGELPTRISTEPYRQVANYYYQQGLAVEKSNMSQATASFDKSIPYLMMIQRMDPGDEFAAAAVPDIYQRTNRLEKAKAVYEKMLQDQPTKQLYVTYGTFMLKSDDWTGAIASYEKSLAIDPGYEPALYNLGALYKNWAAADQKAGKKLDVYKPKIEKSTEYFERLLSVNKSDYNALGQLTENYELLQKKDKQAALLTQLEALKSTEAGNDPSYWEYLGKLYAKEKSRAADAEAAFKKADQLRRSR